MKGILSWIKLELKLRLKKKSKPKLNKITLKKFSNQKPRLKRWKLRGRWLSLN
jgi:hypothetical protein